MSNQAIYEELDNAVNSLLQGDTARVEPSDSTVGELLLLANALREMPSSAFRSRLRLDLQSEAQRLSSSDAAPSHVQWRSPLVSLDGGTPRKTSDEQILPTLFGAGYGNYPVYRSNFVVSAVLHAAAIAIVLASSLWIAGHPQQLKQQVISLIGPGDYNLPAAKTKAGGGGGGGDRDRLAASKGSAPRFASEQITPPAIVIRNDNPKLAAEPTVVGPPDIKLPENASLGDPLSRILAQPSNGTGGGGRLCRSAPARLERHRRRASAATGASTSC